MAGRPATARAATLVAAALAASVILGCGGSSAQGLEQPPGSLDPASPRLSAEALSYDTTRLAVPAGEPFLIVFENREALSHNVSIDDDDGDRRFEGVLFGGPATRWYPVPALEAGTYRFVCDLHPTMAGQLVAE